MKRITVVEKTCGCPLFDKVWEWHAPDQQGPTHVSGLVHFFFKFADNFRAPVGGVRKVVFEEAPETTSRARYGHYESSRRTKARTKTQAALSANGTADADSEAVLMFMAEDARCIACAFVSKALEAQGAALAEATLDKFTHTYAQELAGLRDAFLTEAKNPDESLLCVRFLPNFAGFAQIVEVLTGTFCAVGSHARPASTDAHAQAVHALDVADTDDEGAISRAFQSQVGVNGKFKKGGSRLLRLVA